MIKPLTSLRYFFALMVFFSHMTFIKSVHGGFWDSIYNHFFYEGYLGVSFFFILSGYVLSYSYADKIKNNIVSFKSFWIARFARIYPLHFVTMILAIPFTLKELWQHTALWVVQLTSNLFLIQSFSLTRSIYFSFNYASWSISDEMFFYLVFPFIILMLFTAYKKLLSFFLFLAIAALPLIMLAHPTQYHENGIYSVFPIARVCDFIIGIFLFFLSKKISQKPFQNKNLASALEIFAVTMFILFFAFHENIKEVFRYSVYYWIPMSFIILIFSFQGGYLSKLLSHSFLVLLGEISYGFYLFHQLILRYYDGVILIRLGWHVNHIFEIIVLIPFISIVSYFGYKYIEKPLNKYIKTHFQPVKPIMQ